MNNLSTAFTANGQAFTTGNLDFLQNGTKEAIANTVIGLIGSTYDPTKWYRLQGGVLTNFAGDNYTNTEGRFFYNGEVFYMAAVGGSGTSMPDGRYIVIDETATVPQLFADGSTHAIQMVRTAKWADNVAGGVDVLPLDIRLNAYVKPILGANVITATFERTSYVRMITSSSSGVTITLDPTLGVAGCKAVISIVPTNAGNVVGFSSTGHRYVTGNDTPNGSLDPMTVTIEYAGLDASGDSNYFITINQVG